MVRWLGRSTEQAPCPPAQCVGLPTVQIVAVAIILVIMFADVVLAVIFARRASQPLLHLLQLVRSRAEVQDERTSDYYAQIERTVNRLVESNERVHREFAEHQRVLFGSIVTRLVRGDFLDASELKVFHSSLAITAKATTFTAAIVSIDSSSSAEQSGTADKDGYEGFVLLELLRSLIEPLGLVHALAPSRLALILWRGSGETESTRSVLEGIVRAVHSRAAITLTVAVGGSYDSLADVYKSYEEAEILLRMTIEDSTVGGRPRVIVASSPQIRRNWFHLPQETQLQLYNCLVAGEVDRLQSIIDALYAENIERRELTASTRQLFLQGLLSPISRCLAARASVDSILVEEMESTERHLHRTTDSAESIRLVKQLYTTAAHQSSEQRNNHMRTLVDDVAAYINERYSEQSLCLTSVASAFGVSTYYLSKLFPTYQGCNFSSYVESVRMNAASDLLRTTNLEISVVAERVGFSSPNTFAKAFRRSFGVNPTAYRRGRAAGPTLGHEEANSNAAHRANIHAQQEVHR